jgi:hypothetical protein
MAGESVIKMAGNGKDGGLMAPPIPAFLQSRSINQSIACSQVEVDFYCDDKRTVSTQ